jgi:archaellum component FlaC
MRMDSVEDKLEKMTDELRDMRNQAARIENLLSIMTARLNPVAEEPSPLFKGKKPA